MIAPRSSSASTRSSSLPWLACGVLVVVACSNQITYSRIDVELPDSGSDTGDATSPGIGGKGAGGAGDAAAGGSGGGADAGTDAPIGSGGMIDARDAGTGGAGMGGMGIGGAGMGGMGTGGAGMGGMGTGGAGMGGMGIGGAGMGGAAGGPAIDTAQYNFEASAQGWVSQVGFTAAARMTAQRFAGAASLGATLTFAPPAPMNGNLQDLSVLPAAGTGPVAGNLVTFHVFLPANAAGVIAWVQPFIQDAPQAFFGQYTPAAMLIFGGWNTITLPLPPAVISPIFKIGVQFNTNGTAAFTGTIYVDSISW
jgi:hypothetical protein